MSLPTIGHAILLMLSISAAASAQTATAPRTSLQTHPRYTLNPGDTLDIVYRYSPDFNQTVAIPPDGVVDLKVVGPLKVTGLTLEEAHELVLAKASDRLNKPEITLTIKEFRPLSVVVAGEVLKPATLPFREGETALQAILTAGGFGENAKAGQVILFRRIDNENAEVKILKLNSIKKRADLEHDIALVPGDMILVPRDRISVISRYIKLANVGFYFDPIQNLP